ncbi:MAG: hypothetical protein KJO77_07445 [Bacteroidia bacterium]|nr:hypothetical protein [Bacteroidia bacterium]NND51622.1 hypothetical protein [Flavobacteriaceae bacterium]
MKTKELFELLEAHKDKSLIFEYAPNMIVRANYHITEVKHTSVDSVDCGAASDAWNETIIQLWESPSEIGKTKFMTTLKALGILKKVASIKPYDLEAEVKFEYGNSQFHTAQLFVNDFEISDQKLIMKLAVEKTDCKAKTECGVVEEVKEMVLNGEPCCSPEGNCC